MTNDIKKAIEEERNEAYNNASNRCPYEGHEYHIYRSGYDSGIDKGIEIALSKWEESTRWRKVEDELPECNKDVLVKVTHNEYVHYLVDRYIYHEWQEYYLDGCIIEWQPINK